MPFDRFSTLQIAGDLMTDAGLEGKIASGFHRNTLHNTEGGIDPEEDRVKKTLDRTNTVSTIWLGLTMGCAQCHSHKYDPITQREYYSLYAFFNYLDEQDVGAPLPLESKQFTQQRATFDAEHAPLVAAVDQYVRSELPAAADLWEETHVWTALLLPPANILQPPQLAWNALQTPKAQRTADQAAAVVDYYRAFDLKLAELQSHVDEHARSAPAEPATRAQTISEVSREVRKTHLLVRGNFLDLGPEVSAGTPSVLPLLGSQQPLDRLALCHWLFAADNPLTARVTVNRLWQQYFGRGLVATADDFGTQGERPSHPELLDWLACELRESGWNLKHIQRLILTSATYRQSSAPRPDIQLHDPENSLLARQTRRRVEAEIIRDLALASSGLLDSRIGGPCVRPPQPADYVNVTYANSARWEISKGGDAHRRALYTFFQRTSPYPMLVTFDAPDATECRATRSRSNTPLQALTMWNDPVFFECAQSLAQRIVRDAPLPNDAAQSSERLVAQLSERLVANCAAARVDFAFQLCLSRQPSDDERLTILHVYDQQCKDSRAKPENMQAMIGPFALPPAMDAAEMTGWVAVSRVLLNLDEFITRE